MQNMDFTPIKLDPYYIIFVTIAIISNDTTKELTNKNNYTYNYNFYFLLNQLS